MLCKCYWIVFYIVHVTVFCLGEPFFSGHGVLSKTSCHEPSQEKKYFGIGNLIADMMSFTREHIISTLLRCLRLMEQILAIFIRQTVSISTYCHSNKIFSKNISSACKFFRHEWTPS